MFAGNSATDRSRPVRRAAKLTVEAALEAEAIEPPGRGYDEHGAGRRGYRSSYRQARVKSAEGAIEFAVPQLADTAKPLRSEIREPLRGRTEALERLPVEMYARGLSVRDIEAAFTDESGRCVLSRTAASELDERPWAEYPTFATRDPIAHRRATRATSMFERLREPPNGRHAERSAPVVQRASGSRISGKART